MADDEQGCACIDGMRTVTDVWARQEAGLARGLWPADEIAAHRIGRHAPFTDPQPTCLACWVDLGHAHVAAWRADPTHQLPLTQVELVLLDQWGRYTSALNTVFPCPTCRPDQFSRWRHGCYRPGHAPKRCRLCKDTAK